MLLKVFIIEYPFATGHFKNVIKRANQEPVKKYVYPQTESQEIGWITKPLVRDTKPRTVLLGILIFLEKCFEVLIYNKQLHKHIFFSIKYLIGSS